MPYNLTKVYTMPPLVIKLTASYWL